MKRLGLFFAVGWATISWLGAQEAAPSVEDQWSGTSPNQAWFAATRRVPDEKFIWKEEMDGTRMVVFRMSEGGAEARPDEMVFADEVRGRLPEQIAWTPDSQYLVFSTESSGGHSPWHAVTYIYGVKEKRLVAADDSLGPVVSTTFRVAAPHTVTFAVGPQTADGIDFEHPMEKAVDVATLFGKAGKK